MDTETAAAIEELKTRTKRLIDKEKARLLSERAFLSSVVQDRRNVSSIRRDDALLTTVRGFLAVVSSVSAKDLEQ